MADPDEPAALAYIEKTLSESYRKEIDQEENVWRSLPFFAATLALQLAALFQMIDKLPDPATFAGKLSIGLLALAGALTLASLWFLAASIYPQKFDYIAREPLLLTYAQDLIRDEQAPANQGQPDPFSALVTLKTELARQYAKGADHNRQINKRRERRRSIAGLAALGSVLTTVFLVGTTYAYYLFSHAEKDTGHVGAQIILLNPPAARPGTDPTGHASQPTSPGSASDAGGH